MKTSKIWTDKTNYASEETVIIFGIGFMPESNVTVEVTRPDYHVDSWGVTSDMDGAFTTTYPLNGITGTYTVKATDGTNTATITFIDAVLGY